MQWSDGLIGYDAMNSYDSPSYYARLLFATHLGDKVLNTRLDTKNPRLFGSATYDSKAHRVHIKLVNASSVPQAVSITGTAHVRSHATVATLTCNNTQETFHRLVEGVDLAATRLPSRQHRQRSRTFTKPCL
jgi:alpha-N-arabinofuranosidase